MKKILIIGLALTVLFFAAQYFYKAENNKTADGYQFLTKGFLSSLENINPDYFYQNSPLYETGLEAVGAAKYYGHIADTLCDKISDPYINMLEEGISGVEQVEKFNLELSRQVESMGGRVLAPRLFTRGNLTNRSELVFFNPNYDRTPGASFGGNANLQRFIQENQSSLQSKELYRLLNGIGYEENGIIKTGASYFYDNEIRKGYDKKLRRLKDYLENNHNFEFRYFTYEFDFILPYMFVIYEEIGNLNKEINYVYIEFPVHASGDVYEDTLKLTPVPEKPEVQCRLRGISDARDRKLFSGIGIQEFIAGETYLSPLYTTLPLLYPAPGPYLENPDDIYKDGIKAENVAMPSLSCWLGIYGYLDKDIQKECLFAHVAQTHLGYLMNDLCIGYKKVKRPPPVSYPYYPEKWVSVQNYNLTKTNPRCHGY